MTTTGFALMFLIPITALVVIVYYVKKYRNAAFDNKLNPLSMSINQTRKDLIFLTNDEREKYLFEISQMHDVNIIVWFISDKKHLEEQISPDFPNVKVYLYTSFSPEAINPNIPLVFWSRHPLASVEDITMDKLNNIYLLIGMISIDDELIRYFGGERIKNLISKLGHKEGEILEHSIISSSIRRAQEELDKKVDNPVSANSASDWFILNLNPSDKTE